MQAGDKMGLRIKLFNFIRVCLFIFGIITEFAAAADTVDELQSQYMASLRGYSKDILLFASSDSKDNQEAANDLKQVHYAIHLTKYLDFYAALDLKQDIFQGILNDEALLKIEKKTRGRYLELLEKVFGRQTIDGANFFRFYLNPTVFFTKTYKAALSIPSDVTWDVLFEKLKSSLPPDQNYTATLQINPGRAGGNFDSTSNTIVFGDYKPNIATVIGFVHEFGHSVYLIRPNNESLYTLGTNEAYAEIWANHILQMPIAEYVFPNKSDWPKVTEYLEFRNLLTFRFNLLALVLERKISRKNYSPKQYILTQQRMAQRFLGAVDFPPVIPILPQMRTPGYLEAYAAIPFLGKYYDRLVNSSDLVRSLVLLGPEITGDTSDDFLRKVLGKAAPLFP
jgi:hypothetical protein